MVIEDMQKSMHYSKLFNCATGTWPLKYLGASISLNQLPPDEKLITMLDGWKGSTLSIGARLPLLMACLSNISIYCMSMYLMPTNFLKRLDRTRKRFLQQGASLRKKYRLVKWSKVCLPKKKGGMGVHDVRKMNFILLCKWWWKLEREKGISQDIVHKKYAKQKSITQLRQKLGNP